MTLEKVYYYHCDYHSRNKRCDAESPEAWSLVGAYNAAKRANWLFVFSPNPYAENPMPDRQYCPKHRGQHEEK